MIGPMIRPTLRRPAFRRPAFRLSMLWAAALLATAAPSAAFDIRAMTPDERAAFGAAVKDWLLANPDVLVEMSQKLEEARYEDQLASDRRILREHHTAIFADPNSWIGGNPDGDITVVEFMDYRCGYCRKAHAEVRELVTSDGDIRYVVKEFPILGEASLLSSKFAVAVLQLAGTAAYATAHEALITLRGEPNAATLDRLAATLNLDPEAVKARMESAEVARVIADNRALAAALDIQGTPSYVIDGTMLRGYVPLDGMRRIVAGERG